MHRLSTWIAVAAWSLAGLSPVLAQSTKSASEDTSRSPGPAYLVAFLATALILLIVCMPSRKR